MSAFFVLMALVGMLALGRLLARALEAAEEEHPPTTRRSQPDSLYARLLRASIEGPRDQK